MEKKLILAQFEATQKQLQEIIKNQNNLKTLIEESQEQFHVYQLTEDLANDKSVWFKYAKFYTKKVLEKVSEEVVVDFYIPDDASIPDYVKDEIEVYALKHSITDIELPKHE